VTQARVHAAFGTLPLYFIENQGQVDRRVTYYVQGHDTTVYFTPTGVTLALTGPAAPPPAGGPPGLARPAGLRSLRDPEGARERWAVKLDFVGTNPEARPRGQDPTPAVVSYFKGPRAQWKPGLRTYARLVYPELWPGIDLVFAGTAGRLKYTFLLHPGADPARIRLAYRGATAITLTGAGALDVSTPVGGFRDDRPSAYQEVDGRQVAVAAAYALDPAAPAGTQGYGFRLGPYDRDRPLVIDPAILVYAGYIGGVGEDQGLGIAVDSAGSAYVTGFTTSPEATFPETVGPDLSFNGGTFDAFVAKVNAAGTGLVYAGYIGGAGDDAGAGIAVDSAGSAYVTGVTNSPATTFPVVEGPDLSFNGGTFDAFVARIAEAGPSGKVTGGGQITVTGRRSSFGFNAKQDGGTASGHVNYLNHATRAHLDCAVTAVTELSATRAKFSGTCSSKSAAGSFTAEVEDNREPGKNADRFTIMYGGNTDDDTVSSGNIRIHK
jgi:hypothetical protein